MARRDPDVWLREFVAAGAPRGDEALARARTLVDALGSPQSHAPAVHIVGTAGKGTVAAVLTARLVAAGVRVATHQSPHVDDIRERFLIDGEMVPWPDLAAAIEEIDPAVRTVAHRHGGPPSFFAVTAAMSWVLGRRVDAQVFVTEAGIGGRLDATAVLDRADTLTVLTHIGLDHTDVLGPDVESIAAEKAAVLAGRRAAVLGPQRHAGASSVVRVAAARNGVELHEVGEPSGDWRLDAMATADTVTELLSPQLGVDLPRIGPPVVPGRHEVLRSAGRRVVLDGAHNPDKLAALAAVAGTPRPAVLIAVVGAAKDLRGCAAGVARLGDRVVATSFGSADGLGPQGRSAEAVAAAVADCGAVAEAASDVDAAVARALELTEPGETIVVTGSFLILAAARRAFAAAG